MFTRSVKAMLLGTALVIACALPAGAQTLGVGVSFLEGSTGVTVDYAKPYKTLTNDRSLSWVGDFSIHREGSGNDLVGFEASATMMSFQGGVRMSGPGGDNLTWHVQGLVGLARTSVSVDAAGLNEEICDLFDISCEAGASDTGLVITPGGGINYAFDDTKALRAQLDFLIGDGGTGTRFWVGISFKLGN